MFILSSLVRSEREHIKIANVWKHQVVANKKHPLDDDEAIFSQPQTSADKKVTFAFMTIHCFYTAPPVEQWCPISLLLYLFIACNVSLIQLGKGGTYDVLQTDTTKADGKLSCGLTALKLGRLLSVLFKHHFPLNEITTNRCRAFFLIWFVIPLPGSITF